MREDGLVQPFQRDNRLTFEVRRYAMLQQQHLICNRCNGLLHMLFCDCQLTSRTKPHIQS